MKGAGTDAKCVTLRDSASSARSDMSLAMGNV